jgi:hypothetical protein
MGRLKKNKAQFFVGACTKLRKATVGFVVAGCPSGLMEQLSLNGRIFIKFDILEFFENL